VLSAYACWLTTSYFFLLDKPFAELEIFFKTALMKAKNKRGQEVKNGKNQQNVDLGQLRRFLIFLEFLLTKKLTDLA
jgi:hypothetical protein